MISVSITITEVDIMSKYCPNCGCQSEDDAMFCVSCGERLNEIARFCTSCGAELEANCRFCVKCGNQVQLFDRPQPTAQKNNWQALQPRSDQQRTVQQRVQPQTTYTNTQSTNTNTQNADTNTQSADPNMQSAFARYKRAR